MGEGERLALKLGDEVLWQYVRLAQQPSQGADFEFAVHWDDASLGALACHDMTAALSYLLKTKPLKCLERFCARHTRELRHGPEY